MKRNPCIFPDLGLILILILVSTTAFAQDNPEQEPIKENPFVKASVDEISRKLENPLTTLWSLTLQENYSIKEWGTTDLPDSFGHNQDSKVGEYAYQDSPGTAVFRHKA